MFSPTWAWARSFAFCASSKRWFIVLFIQKRIGTITPSRAATVPPMMRMVWMVVSSIVR